MISLSCLLNALAGWFDDCGGDAGDQRSDIRPVLTLLGVAYPESLPALVFDAIWYATSQGLPTRGRGVEAKALGHYVGTGAIRRSDPVLWFNESFYQEAYSDVGAGIAAGRWQCGYHHYLQRGMAEHRSPSPEFNEMGYLGGYPDLLEAVRNRTLPGGYVHYALIGQYEGRQLAPPANLPPLLSLPVVPSFKAFEPSPHFAERLYREANPDIKDDGAPSPGMRHWLTYGYLEDLAGARPRARDYVENVYLRENADLAPFVRSSGQPSGYHHFLMYGAIEGRSWAGRLAKLAETALMRQALSTRSPFVTDGKEWPIISVIVPVYDPHTAALRACIDSVRSQTYPHWELCLTDDGSRRPETVQVLLEAEAADGRIRVTFSPSNGGISAASNLALEQGRGEFVALLDHDDILAPDALLHVARAAMSRPDVDLVYTDEGKLTEDGAPVGLALKPGWSPEFLLSTMYIGHLTVYRRSVIEQAGGFRSTFDGTQDYDLALRVAEIVRSVVHVPMPLYFWRMSATSTAASLDAKPGVLEVQRRAIESALLRRGSPGTVKPGHGRGHWDVVLELSDKSPLVSIVIPTAGQTAVIGSTAIDLVVNCIRSIMATETYPNIEFIVVHNGDLQSSTMLGLSGIRQVRLVRYAAAAFNLSEKINLGVQSAAGEFVLLLNDDMQADSLGIVRSMMGRMFDGVGIIGGRLLYANSTLQHAGIVWTAEGPTHAMIGEHRLSPGPSGRLHSLHNCFGVSGACMFFRRNLFLELGGFNPQLATNYNDVELCLKAQRSGFRIAFNPDVTMYHFESLSKAGTFFWELQLLLLAFPGLSDPYVSSLFSPHSPFFEPLDPTTTVSRTHRAWMMARIDARRQLRPSGDAIRFSFILSVYETPAPFLRELEATVLHQTYRNWELVLVDNGCREPATIGWIERVRTLPNVTFVRLATNQGIMGGYGAAFRAAGGDYVVPIDSDDILTLDCLDVLAHFLEANGMPDAVYSDEDKADSRSNTHSPFLKPDWDPVLFTNMCFVAHVCAIRRVLAADIGAYMDDAAAGCHDWDTFLRLLRADATIRHVPEVLYSWRIHSGSTASIETGNKPYTITSQKHVLDQHLRLTGLDQTLEVVENKLFPHNGMWRLSPRPSMLPASAVLLIASSDPAAMTGLLGDLVRSRQSNSRILVVGDTTDLARVMDDLPREFIQALWPKTRAPACVTLEQAAALCDAEGRIAAVIDGTTVAGLNRNWLAEGLAMFEASPDVGLAGGQVMLPNGQVAWRGGFAGFGGMAGAPDYGRSVTDSGYHGTGWCQRSCDSVPSACFFAKPTLLQAASAELAGKPLALRQLVGQLVVTAWSKDVRIVYTPFVQATLTREIAVEPILPRNATHPKRGHYYHSAFSHVAGSAYALLDPVAGLALEGLP